MTTRITFVRAWGIYAPGDVAGFSDAVAADLVAAGEASSPIAVADPAPATPDPAAVAAAGREIARLGTNAMIPGAGTELACINPRHFAP